MATTPVLHPGPAQTALAAAKSLFVEGGPFALDRNPVLLLGPAGEILAANGAAAPLVKGVAAPPQDLAAAIMAARKGAAGRLAAIELAGADGKPLSLDLT